MIIDTLKEIKAQENRIDFKLQTALELTCFGHDVLIEKPLANPVVFLF